MVHRTRSEIWLAGRANSPIEHKGKQSSEKGPALAGRTAQVNLNRSWRLGLKSWLWSQGTQSQPCGTARQKPARLSPLILTEGGGLPPPPQGLGNSWGPGAVFQVRWMRTLSTTMPTSGSPFPPGYWAKQGGGKAPCKPFLREHGPGPWACPRRFLGLGAGHPEDRP